MPQTATNTEKVSAAHIPLDSETIRLALVAGAPDGAYTRTAQKLGVDLSVPRKYINPKAARSHLINTPQGHVYLNAFAESIIEIDEENRLRDLGQEIQDRRTKCNAVTQ